MSNVVIETNYTVREETSAIIELLLSDIQTIIFAFLIPMFLVILFCIFIVHQPGLILLPIIIVMVSLYYELHNNLVFVLMSNQKEEINVIIDSNGIEMDNTINRIFISSRNIIRIRETKNYYWLLTTDKRIMIYMIKPKNNPELLRSRIEIYYKIY